MQSEPNKKYLGDYIKDITTKLGIKSCIPCQARQARMNLAHQNLTEKVKRLFSRGS